MFKHTLTTILGIICLLTFSFSEDKFSSFRDLKKISNGMSLIHESDSNVGIIAIHGFYPAYWVGKTWIEGGWVDGNPQLKLTSYLMDETTKITDTIKIPFK